MSLFKGREWWSTLVGENEEFDQGCLCVANIDNSANGHGSDKIIVGSFHGFLRIFNPRPVKTETGWSGYRPEDVLCETSLGQPILQVAAGKFVSGTDKLHLAVLHPRKVSVHSVVASVGSVEQGNSYQIKLAYEHNLQRTAFNFCHGPFGGVKDKDFLCVQSMDGTVSVFEQESFAFSRFLPGALLPGPLRYVPRTDSFVTVSSSRHVESYKYQVLAVATDAKTKEESQSIKSGKRVAADWTFNIGEQAMDMYVSCYERAPTSIIILGERSLFCVSEGGKLRFMKKFEYNPSCFLPYNSVSDNTVNTIVATHTNTLMVYQDFTLKWAAQVQYKPVQVCVANFQDLQGAVVTLDEEGHLQAMYLGTDPAMFTTPTAEVREIDYTEQDHEMKKLQKIIKEQQHKNTGPTPNKLTAEDDIQIIVQVPHNLDEISRASETEVQDEDPIPSITVKIILKAKTHVHDVKVAISVALPLFSTETLINFPSIDPARPAEANVTFFMKFHAPPARLVADATATFQNTSGAPRVVHAPIKLPLKLVARPCLPVKSANFKVTVDTNKSPVNLNDIFPDMLGENAGGPGNALGFQFYGGSIVTMLASKTSQRYRLQCDEFESMWLLLNEMVNRLTSYHMSRKMTDFRCSYEGALPLQEYFDVLEKHFECRLNEEHYRELLSQRATQFRAIQRRLLTRFKDKTPAPLANLDTLLDGTYRQVLALADAVEENRRVMEHCALRLSCATYMLNLMIKLWRELTDGEFAVLEGALSPIVIDNGEQGWEEIVDVAITHMLRTCLAKSSKDQTVNPAPLQSMKDTGKLKKHIALLCDRLGKGARLVVEGQQLEQMPERPVSYTEKSKKPVGRTPSQDSLSSGSGTPNSLGAAEVPLGSKFGENKKHSPRHKKELPPLANGTNHEPEHPEDDDGYSSGKGNKFMKKKSKENVLDEGVPDLDDIGGGREDDAYMVNGGAGELVYGL